MGGMARERQGPLHYLHKNKCRFSREMVQLSFCMNSSRGERVNQKAAVQSTLALITLHCSHCKHERSAVLTNYAIWFLPCVFVVVFFPTEVSGRETPHFTNTIYNSLKHILVAMVPSFSVCSPTLSPLPLRLCAPLEEGDKCNHLWLLHLLVLPELQKPDVLSRYTPIEPLHRQHAAGTSLCIPAVVKMP